MLTVLISGILQGIEYALISLGLVLIYRQSRVLNFSHGAIATVAAYIVHALLLAQVSYWIAAVFAVGVAVVLSIIIERTVVRPISRGGEHSSSIGTIGVGLILIGAVTFWFGTTQFALPPAGGKLLEIQIGALAVGSNKILMLIVAVSFAALLLVILEYTRLGTALRAISEGPLTAQMLGVNTRFMRQVVWGVAGALAAIAALLIVPEHYLDPYFATDFMISAFVAVVLGGFESIFGVMLGAVLFGIFSAFFSYYVTDGLTNTVAFASIFIVLLVRPHGLFGHKLKSAIEPKIKGASPRWLKPSAPIRNDDIKQSASPVLLWLLITAAATIAAPSVLSVSQLYVVALTAVTFIAVTSQNLISGYSGQLSLGQSGFMVLGAYVFVILQNEAHFSFLAALACVPIVAAILGLCFGYPAIRLTGVYLAVMTMTFALAVPELAGFGGHVTGGALGIEVRPPRILGHTFGGTRALYWMAAAGSWLIFVSMQLLAAGPAGRRWRAVRDSEPGAFAVGVNVRRTKVEVFALGAALAALSGAMGVVLVGYLSPENYTLWTGILLLLAVIIGGAGSMLGSVLGSILITGVPVLFSGLPEVPQIAFGLTVVIFLILAPDGLAALSLRLGPSRSAAAKPTTSL